MSEIAPTSSEYPLVQALLQVSRFCISPDAVIEPGAHIKLWMAPDGRRTQIGSAHIETGVIIDELTHVHDGVLVGKDALLQFRSTIKNQCQIGHQAIVGMAVTLEQGVNVAPESKVGNFSIIGENCVLDWDTEIEPQVYIAPGLSVHGKVGPHTSIRAIV